MQAAKSGGSRDGVDETLGFFAEVDARLLSEIAAIEDIRLPGFSGCRIGSRMTILRDVESGQLLATVGVSEAPVRLFMDCPMQGLFCERSPWLQSWVEARYRERLLIFERQTGTKLEAFKDSPERAAIWIAARLCKTDIAKRASDRVAKSLELLPCTLALAQRVREAEAFTSNAIRFEDVSLVLRAGVILERLSIEHPKWLGFVTMRMRTGILSTQLDPMAQLKQLALAGGASHAAWASLSADGPGEFRGLVRSDDDASCRCTDLLNREWVSILDVAKARHWIGQAWRYLHPEMHQAIVKVVLAYAGSLDVVEPLLRAMGAEAIRRSARFEGLAEFENEFRELLTTLLSYAVACHDRDNRVLHPARVRAPTRHRWADWVRWARRFRSRWGLPFWVPLATYSSDDFVAEALSTRADIEQESRRMANCIAGYADRCFAGRYVLFRIACRNGTTVATFGATIELQTTERSRPRAIDVFMDEVAGRDNSPVDPAIQAFAAQLTGQIRLRLPCEVPEPGW